MIFDVKFVTPEDVPDGAVIVSDPEEVHEWRMRIDVSIQEAKRELSYGRGGQPDQEALESLEAWVRKLELERWTPERTVLVKCPLLGLGEQ